jgi:molybdopterin-guanine dinucleotide biosynthesis protein A
MLVGIFVGGGSRRMGGRPKGLLPAPDGSGSLVERLVRVAREALADGEPVLVGGAEPYAALALPALTDQPPGSGPIGGLIALLAAAGRRPAIALACDLPAIRPELVARLAHEAPAAAALAPRMQGRWQPLVARYDPPRALAAARGALAAGRRSLQAVFDALGAGAAELALDAEERATLDDWDEPADVGGAAGEHG